MKNLFSRMFNSIPKRLAAGAIIALAIMLPVASSAAGLVKIEADTTVANATTSAGTMQWGSTTAASYNQVVAVQVVYKNDEVAGSAKTANNLRVKVTLPTTAGTSQTVTTKTSADNSNTITGSAKVTLDNPSAYLEYIPGTATWKHAQTANGPLTIVQKVSDAVVTSPTGLVLENENPCQAGSIVVQARVMVPSTKVVKQVEKANETGKWATMNTANPGDILKYMITYTNTGNTTAKNVLVRDNLPPYLTYVPNTTYITNSNHAALLDSSNVVTTDGIIVGDYAPGAVAYVTLEAKVADASTLSCGATRLTNVGIAHPQGTPEFYNTAYTDVTKTCTPVPPTPTYSCTALSFSQTDTRSISANATYAAANGATYNSTSFAWGDGSTTATGNHTYAQDGTYTITASITFMVNGVLKTVTAPDCSKTVTIKTPATPVYTCNLVSLNQLPNRAVTASVTYTATGGASLKTTTFDWGDGSTPLTTSNTTAQYSYAKDGTYTVTAKLLFSVNGKDVFVNGDNCSKLVTISTTTPPVTPPAPTVLPNTGAGNVIGIFAGAVVAGTIGYRLFLSRKLAR